MKSGFTLIETMIALTVLTMLILGPITLATKSISYALTSQNQITASYLAQEAVEYILNIRDNNFLHIPSLDWLEGLNQCFGAWGCYIDVPNKIINPCGGECPKIKYDSSGFYYNYGPGQDTIFIRKVKIKKIEIGGVEDEARVEVTVQWPERFGGQKSFTLQEEIFNWK